MLHLRSIRAHEHWKGNTDTTLLDVAVKLDEEGAFDDEA
jgi:hypothetical protein